MLHHERRAGGWLIVGSGSPRRQQGRSIGPQSIIKRRQTSIRGLFPVIPPSIFFPARWTGGKAEGGMLRGGMLRGRDAEGRKESPLADAEAKIWTKQITCHPKWSSPSIIVARPCRSCTCPRLDVSAQRTRRGGAVYVSPGHESVSPRTHHLRILLLPLILLSASVQSSTMQRKRDAGRTGHALFRDGPDGIYTVVFHTCARLSYPESMILPTVSPKGVVQYCV